jgi:sterol desaturase/sphingolipid hydroxylase (fatty acid hydroxylase superfamily)
MTGFLVSLGALVAASLSVATAERTVLRRGECRDGRRPYLATDLAWYGVTIAAGALAALVFRPVFTHLAWSVTEAPLRRAPFVVQALIAVAVYDFVAFAVHIAYHRSNRLWEFHKVHHSSRHLDGLATTRTHMFEHFTRGLPAQAAVLALGLPVSALVVALAIYAAFAVLGHGDLVLPRRPLEPIFITPRLHQVHHVPATTNRNYATIFTFWDRCFRTFERVSAPASAIVGVPGEVETYPQLFVPAAREPFRRLVTPPVAADAAT